MLRSDDLFDREDLDALINLIDVVENADDKGSVYNMSTQASDAMQKMIDKNKNFTEEEKKRLKTRFNVRRRNQNKIEKLSLAAEDIRRGKDIANGTIKPNRDGEDLIK